MTSNHARLTALIAAIFVAAALRLLPHPPNFTPIGAMALFSGVYLGRRWLAFGAPLAAMLLSDLVLGFYPGFAFTYASVALIVLVGWAVRSRISALRVGAGAVTGSVLFFIVSNFGAWAATGMYPHNAGGLAACYVAAIPFFQSTLAGDLVFAALLFGGFALAERAAPTLRAGTPQAA